MPSLTTASRRASASQVVTTPPWNTSGPDIEVAISEDEQQLRAEAAEKMAEAQQIFVAKVKELCDELDEERLAALKPKTAALIQKGSRDFDEANTIRKSVFAKGQEAKVLGELENQVKRHQKRAEQGSFQIGFGSRVMRELAEPRETFVMERGDFLTPGAKVTASTPGALHPFPPGAPETASASPSGWASPDNPLTARVAVNRLWAEPSARLVATMEDFGHQGERPTHPGDCSTSWRSSFAMTTPGR